MHNQSNPSAKSKWPLGAISLRVFGDGGLCLVLLSLYFQEGNTGQLISAGVVFLTFLVSLAGLLMARRGQAERGAWVVILSLFPSSLVLSSLASGIGFLVGLAVLVMTFLVAFLSFQLASARLAIILGTVFAALNIAIQFYQTGIGVQFTEITPLIWALIALLLLGVGGIIAVRFRQFNLQTKFVSIFFTVSLVGFLAVLVVTAYTTTLNLEERIGEEFFSLAQNEAGDVRQLIVRQFDKLEVLSLNVAIRSVMNARINRDANQTEQRLVDSETAWQESTDRADLAERLFVSSTVTELENFVSVFPEHSQLMVTDSRGGLIAATFTPEHFDQSGEDWWQNLTQISPNTAYVGRLLPLPEGDVYGIELAIPIFRSETGEFVGAIRSVYQIDDILRNLRDIQVGQAGQVELLLEQNGEWQVLDEATGQPIPLEDVRQAVLNDTDWTQKVYQQAPFPQEVSLLTLARVNLQQAEAEQVITGDSWFLLVHQDRVEALALINSLVGASLLTTFVAIALIAILAFWVSGLIVGPITSLTEIVRQVSEGDFDVTAPVTTQDETGQLAMAFNTMTERLRESISSLETKIHERTTDILTSLEVGQQALTTRDVETLLPNITEFIRSRFGLYYTQVYRVDEENNQLLLWAGTGEVGRMLEERQHSLPIDHNSIVGRATIDSQSIVVPDTAESDIHKSNDLLPDTRSELAVPLMVEDRVIGVLDMQATTPNQFNMENVPTFAAMATQLAAAIDSVQQLSAAREAQQRTEEIIRRYTRQNWSAYLKEWQAQQGLQLVRRGDFPQSVDDLPTVQVSLQVQNQAIGALSVKQSPEQKWSEDEQELLNAVAEKLSQKAENLRLLEQSQRRAAREEITREITDKIRASQDIESALRIAAEELSKALNVSKAVIDLQVDAPRNLEDEAALSLFTQQNNGKET